MESSAATDRPGERQPDLDSGASAPYRVVFFGTPSYAVPTLEALVEDPLFDVRLVVTQPDRSAGRKRDVRPPAVKQTAEKLALPVYQPESLKNQAVRQPIVEAEPDLFVVAAYGLIFGRQSLGIPRLGSFNLHASLLPRYRGASPICAAILEGERETGVTLMKMDQGLDTGPTLGAKAIEIAPDDTTQSLTDKLSHLAADVTLEFLPASLAGTRPLVPQQGPYSVVRQLIKADGWIDWNQSAEHIARHVRAMWSWPRAWTVYQGATVQVHRAIACTDALALEPGSATVTSSGVRVACRQGSIMLERVQPAGRGAMDALAWARGLRTDQWRFDDTSGPDIPTPLIRHVQ